MPPPAAFPETLRPGTMLGRYEIVRTISGSGLVRTYEAIHRGLERRVALKVLSPLPAAQSEVRARFFEEAEVASRVRHPNLVDVIEIVPDQPLGYVVMELLHGEDLARLIARDAPLSIDLAVDGLLPVAAAIAAAHERGTIHRSLSPGNIFLAETADGFVRPKVLNLGIMKISGVARTMALSDVTEAASASSYLAPEQVRDPRAADARSDQYALGAILYECLTGRRAFEGENQFATLRIISAGACPAPRSWRRDLPARLDAAVMKAMSLEPAARFPSMKHFGAALVELASPGAAESWRPFFVLSPSATLAGPGGQGAPFAPAARFAPGAPAAPFAPFAPLAPVVRVPAVALSPRPFEETPIPAAKVGGTMVLPDAEPSRRSASRSPSRASHFTPRPTRETGRRARLGSPPQARPSRFLTALTPAVTLLALAGLLVASDRWGVELWLQYLPAAVPGSSEGEAAHAPAAEAEPPPRPRAAEPDRPRAASGVAPPAAAAPEPPAAAAPARAPSAATGKHRAKKRGAKVARRHRASHAGALIQEETSESSDAPARGPPAGELLPLPEK